MLDKSDLALMQKVMKHRKNWQLTDSESKFNFKWKYNTQGLMYHKLSMTNYQTPDQYQVIYKLYKININLNILLI